MVTQYKFEAWRRVRSELMARMTGDVSPASVDHLTSKAPTIQLVHREDHQRRK